MIADVTIPAAGPTIGVELTPSQEVAILARILHREGYSQGYQDALAGHITYRQPDGTLLVNPFAIEWSQLSASEVARTDADGRHLEGPYEINPATTLHFALHAVRHDAAVAIHNHPRWATIWADHARLPPAYDQTSALFDGEMSVVEEFDGTVLYRDIADRVVGLLGTSTIGLLAHHGVLVIGHSMENAVTRALGFEARCRLAWHVEALGPGAAPLPQEVCDALAKEIEKRHGAFPSLWTALARREIRLDPSVLD
jgi:ribulose-5-phosphate 4-epimerase/fuculose-1-phosphate aldolase